MKRRPYATCERRLQQRIVSNPLDAHGTSTIFELGDSEFDEDDEDAERDTHESKISTSGSSVHRSAVRDPGTYSYGLVYVFWSLSVFEQHYFLKKSVQQDIDEGRRSRDRVNKEADMVKRLSRTKRFVWEPQINNPERTIIEINKELNQLTPNVEKTDRAVEILMRFMSGKELMFHRFATSESDTQTPSYMRVLPEPGRVTFYGQ